MFATSPKLKWKTVPFAKANKAYSMKAVTKGAIDPVEHDMGWPDEEPAYRVFEGDVVAKGPAIFGADDEDDCTAHVIAGDLKIDGPLIVFQAETQGVLFVTGSVTCTDCLIAMDGQLVVGGSLSIQRTLATGMSQMGALCVAGELSATDWVETSTQGLLWLGRSRPKARFVNALESGTWPPAHRTEGSSKLDYSQAIPGKIVAKGAGETLFAIKAAMVAGKPIVEFAG